MINNCWCVAGQDGQTPKCKADVGARKPLTTQQRFKPGRALAHMQINLLVDGYAGLPGRLHQRLPRLPR